MRDIEAMAGLDLGSASGEAFLAAARESGLIDRLLRIAVEEDVGAGGLAGDRTAAALGLRGGVSAEGFVVSRSDGVIAGLALIGDVVRAFGAGLGVEVLVGDGSPVSGGDRVARLWGDLGEMVVVERTILNVVGRLSGVATMTARFVESMREGAPGSRTRLYDTRKTTPGLRLMEKYAVRCGGGCSHRLGLHDAVMLKDNHLAGVGLGELAGFVRGVSERARDGVGGVRFVEVEVDSLEQLDAVLTLEDGVVDVVMLDNMGVEALAAGVRRRNESGRRVELECSGGVTLEKIGEIARTNIDRVSTGSVTHSASWLDVGLDVGLDVER